MRFVFEDQLAAARRRIAELEHLLEQLNLTVALYQDERALLQTATTRETCRG